MSDEIKSETPTESTERRVWETPSLTRLDTEQAEGSFAGIGVDAGIYS